MVTIMLMRICKCGRRLPQGETCPCQKKRHKLYDAARRDKDKKKFYASRHWRRIVSAVKARANGLDEYLLAVKGVIAVGTTVHHIYPVTERPDLKTSLDNLIFVSAQTHNKIHAEYNRDAESKSAMQKILTAIRQGTGVVKKVFEPSG